VRGLPGQPRRPDRLHHPQPPIRPRLTHAPELTDLCAAIEGMLRRARNSQDAGDPPVGSRSLGVPGVCARQGARPAPRTDHPGRQREHGGARAAAGQLAEYRWDHLRPAGGSQGSRSPVPRPALSAVRGYAFCRVLPVLLRLLPTTAPVRNQDHGRRLHAQPPARSCLFRDRVGRNVPVVRVGGTGSAQT
jgi:hypothetical protein